MRHLAAVLTGLGLGLAAIGPGLAPGFVLSYDMVFVPDPSFSRMTFGLTGVMPRHVPSDAFVTALSTVMPADLVQKLILLAIFVMACSAAASLVPSERLLPRLAAGVCYAWNPFVAERLRCAFAQSRIRRYNSEEPVGNITISAGVAAYRAGEHCNALIERADAALYTSKAQGRNRVTVAE